MVIVSESVRSLKGFIAKTGLRGLAQVMVLRLVLAFIGHRGRMTCSTAAGSVTSECIHRGQLTRFLARPRWQIELFFKELKSTLCLKLTGRFAQYRFENFDAVTAWVEIALTTVLSLEHECACHLANRRLNAALPKEYRIAV